EADAEGLHHGLFGGETGGEALGGIATPGPGGLLALGEQPPHDTGRAVDHPPKAVDLDGVDADPRQGWLLQRSASRWSGCSSRSITGMSPSTSSRNTGSVSVTASRRM